MADKALIAHWKDWLKSRAFYVVGFQYMATRMLVNVPQVFVTLYANNNNNANNTLISFHWPSLRTYRAHVASFLRLTSMLSFEKCLGVCRFIQDTLKLPGTFLGKHACNVCVCACWVRFCV